MGESATPEKTKTHQFDPEKITFVVKNDGGVNIHYSTEARYYQIGRCDNVDTIYMGISDTSGNIPKEILDMWICNDGKVGHYKDNPIVLTSEQRNILIALLEKFRREVPIRADDMKPTPKGFFLNTYPPTPNPCSRLAANALIQYLSPGTQTKSAAKTKKSKKI